MTRCFRCEAVITFSGNTISKKTGSMVPLEPHTMEPHRCPYFKPQKKYQPCHSCGAFIYFDSDAPKSASGEMDPH